MKRAISLLAPLLIAGCAFTPPPAHTSVTPSESRIISEREEKLPSFSTIRISTETAKTEPMPSVRVRITVPESGPR